MIGERQQVMKPITKVLSQNIRTETAMRQAVTGMSLKALLSSLTVNPSPTFLLEELHLDTHRYERYELAPYPEIDNPPKVWNYVDNLNGITIRTQSSRAGGRGEEVAALS